MKAVETVYLLGPVSGTLILGSENMTDDARHRLIVALDKDEDGNSRLVDTLGDSVTFYKVGAVSLFSGGERLLRRLLDAGKSVFLDLKIFDVPNTVGRSVARVAQLGVTFTTVHGNRPTVEAAVAIGRNPATVTSVPESIGQAVLV